MSVQNRTAGWLLIDRPAIEGEDELLYGNAVLRKLLESSDRLVIPK